MITNVYSVAIFVADRERALRFYREGLDFEVTADVTDPTNSDHRWLTMRPKSGQTNVMLLKESRKGEAGESFRTAPVTLATNDIAADCERIKAHGGRVVHPPKRAGWGNALETHFSDPDGNLFLLVEQIDGR